MIDLHIHTNYSDGTNTIAEILELAEKQNMEIISITDHDKVNAYFDLEDENIRKIFSGKIIPGAEFTTTYKGGIVEVLGYGIDYKYMNEQLKEENFRKALPNEKIPKFIEKYKDLGIKFDEKILLNNMRNKYFNRAMYDEFILYHENDKFLSDISNKETFSKFMRNEMNSYTSKIFVDQTNFFPKMETVIGEIHNAGGLAFLAHAYIYAPYVANELEEIVNTYKLDGLECFYTTFAEKQTDEINKFCDKHKLYRSGGTDFHGVNPNKMGYQIGSGKDNNLSIDNSVIDNWIEKVKVI